MTREENIELGVGLMRDNMPILIEVEAEADNKVLYWAGVLSYLRGMMIASIGIDGARAVDVTIVAQGERLAATRHDGETMQ